MFQLDSTTHFTQGHDERFYHYREQLTQFLLKSNQILKAKWALYSITDSANLAEFKVGKGFLNGLTNVAKKKIVYKLLEPRILGTAGMIPFKFDTQGN